MATDPLNLNGLALTLEQVATLAPLQKKAAAVKARRARTKFVMLPYEQTLTVAGQIGDATLAVLVELAHRRFKTHRNPVSLPTEGLEAVGISRWAKKRALDRLEKAGSVEVTWRRGRSPLVKIL